MTNPCSEPVGCDESYLDLTKHMLQRPFIPDDDKTVLESPCQPCYRKGQIYEKSIDELVKLKVSQRVDYVKERFLILFKKIFFKKLFKYF